MEHTFVDGSWRIQVREKMLECSSVVLRTLSPYCVMANVELSVEKDFGSLQLNKEGELVCSK